MAMLTGKKGLIFGVANERSLAWACAQMATEQGADVAITYLAKDKVFQEHILPLAKKQSIARCYYCDVTNEESLNQTFTQVAQQFGSLDFVVHSLAFANKEELGGKAFRHTSLAGFQQALEISSYSLVKIAALAAPLMTGGGAITCMTYLGSSLVMKNYNVMGVAKAALESIVRYLAADLGMSQIRVNAISPGPILTRAASGIANFAQMLDNAKAHSLLGRNITAAEVAATNTFLVSNWASGITGQVLFVDGGHSVVAAGGS